MSLHGTVKFLHRFFQTFKGSSSKLILVRNNSEQLVKLVCTTILQNNYNYSQNLDHSVQTKPLNPTRFNFGIVSSESLKTTTYRFRSKRR